ncbi:hypothetical protein [Paraburkholderia dipogonis]|uniref:hypothetical protein n=1 Tax=Paraburkholderia dipogonis TaxID=1211383 RepID=UPI0038B933F3
MPLLGRISHQTKSAVRTITVFVLAFGVLVGAVCYSHNNDAQAIAPIATPAVQPTPVATTAPVVAVVDAGSEAASEVDEANSLAAADSADAPAIHKWFIADLNHAHCLDGGSPADKIRETQSDGIQAKTTDFGDKVEVIVAEGLQERVLSYYRSEAACDASLPGNQPIPSKYE